MFKINNQWDFDYKRQSIKSILNLRLSALNYNQKNIKIKMGKKPATAKSADRKVRRRRVETFSIYIFIIECVIWLNFSKYFQNCCFIHWLLTFSWILPKSVHQYEIPNICWIVRVKIIVWWRICSCWCRSPIARRSLK